LQALITQRYGVAKHALRLMRRTHRLTAHPRLFRVLRKALDPLVLEKETRWNQGFRWGTLLLGTALSEPGELAATRHIFQDMLDYMTGYLEPEQAGRPVVWSEWNLSNEILRGFDVTPYIPETLAVMAQIAGTDCAVRIVEEAEAAGLPAEYCSASKFAVGGLLLGQSPEPDLIITSSHPCDSVTSVYQVLHYLTRAPLFVLDTPYWDDEASFAYYEKNLRELISFLERHLNQKLDWDRLAQVCQNVNVTNRCLQDVTEMARAVPSPTSAEVLLFHWIDRMACFGSANGARYAQAVYEATQARLKAGKGVVPEERIRVIWYDVPVTFAPLYAWLEREFGAVTVADFIGRIQQVPIDTRSEESILQGLARTHLACTMVRQTRGPAEFYTTELHRIIEEYAGDCFLFMGHQGCKGGWAILRLLRDICRKAGIPALFLSTDIFDKRCLSEERIKQEITEFFRSHNLA